MSAVYLAAWCLPIVAACVAAVRLPARPGRPATSRASSPRRVTSSDPPRDPRRGRRRQRRRPPRRRLRDPRVEGVMSGPTPSADCDAGLFDLAPVAYADVSDDGLYRYTLGRRWGVGPAATFIMLNPSTADATQDDPTIRRCIGFAKAFGCDALHVANLYAFRATKPADLWKAADPVGPDNDETLRSAFRTAYRERGPVIAAWGANANPLRARFVAVIAQAAGVTLTALGVTKDGAPRHPLYLPASAEPSPWTCPIPPGEGRDS